MGVELAIEEEKEFRFRFHNLGICAYPGGYVYDEVIEMEKKAATVFASLIQQLPLVSTLYIEPCYMFSGGSLKEGVYSTALEGVERICNSMLRERGSDQKMVFDEDKFRVVMVL